MENLYDLSMPQKAILLTEQFYGNSVINNLGGTSTISNSLDFELFKKAIHNLVKCNDSFRIRFIQKNNEIKQYIQDFSEFPIDIVDVKTQEEVKLLEKMQISKPFHLFSEPLFEFKLFRLPDNSGGYVLRIHHSIADAWTSGLLCRKLIQEYSNLLDNKQSTHNSKCSYTQFLQSENDYLSSAKFEKDKLYWEEKFSTLPNIVSLPSSNRSSDNFSCIGNRQSFVLPIQDVNKIRDFCKEHSISTFNFFMAILATYIHKINHIDDFVLGTPILNRTNVVEKNTTGMFINIAPLRISFEKTSNFLDLIKNISKDSMGLLRHQKYPYQNILQNIRKVDASIPNLYNILLSYQITSANHDSEFSYTTHWAFNGCCADDLDIHLYDMDEEGILNISYDYKICKYSESDITSLHNRLLHMIKQVLKTSNVTIEHIEIITKLEKEHLLKDFHKTNVTYNSGVTLHELFERQARKTPNAIAVIDKNSKLTYQQLNSRANFLANQIKNLHIKTDIIAFSLERTSNIIIAILAILKSGHTYMPIDPDYPIDRINYMLQNSNTKIVIANESFLQNIQFNGGFINFEYLKFNKNYGNLNLPISSTKNAYIMYTSGSTGLPKAVAIKHYNVYNFVKSVQKIFDYKPSDTNNVLSVTTICFDIFVAEVFPTLLSGLTLVIADELEARSPKLLSQLIEKHNISKIWTTPSRIELLFMDKSYAKCLSSVKEFALGGEPVPIQLVEKLRTLTSAKIVDLYGPTETTVYSTFKDLTYAKDITIGKPINNTQVYILDDNLKLLPIGQVGEICICGDGVGNGYYNNPEKTKEVFVKNPYGKGTIYKTGDLGYFLQNGELVCLGRKDFQVKIRGYRIELNDISNNLNSFDGIKKSIVIDKEDNNGTKFLCAYFIATKNIDINELRKYLITLLPNYMIPKYFMQLDEFPLTLNHKIDRKAFPMPNTTTENTLVEYEEPKTETQKKLCEIIQKELNIAKIGISNDLFNFNIDSLEIIRIQTRMLSYHYKVNTQDFYNLRTIEKLANLIDNHVNVEGKIDSKSLKNINQTFHKHDLSTPIEITKNTYQNILLIGSTGYLGIHLLNTLLTKTKATIYCIVRDKNNTVSSERLCELYHFYFNKELDLERVTIISSDITKENLGLSNKNYINLSNNIDLIINAAANVKYYGTYEEFKKINIDVVKSLIEFSIQNNIKLVHISTLGICGNILTNHTNGATTFSENDFYIGQTYTDNVYIQTKFEAEKLIYEYTNKGLSALIFRVGNLTGRKSDGVFQRNIEDNAFYHILRMILKFHIVPDSLFNEYLEFTPIDECANAIITLLSNTNTDKYVFHVFNQNYISVHELINYAKSIGFETEILSGTRFKNTILELCNELPKDNILKGIVNNLDDQRGLSLHFEVAQSNNFTNYYLNNCNFHWSKIDDTYLSRIINHIRKNNYI